MIELGGAGRNDRVGEGRQQDNRYSAGMEGIPFKEGQPIEDFNFFYFFSFFSVLHSTSLSSTVWDRENHHHFSGP